MQRNKIYNGHAIDVLRTFPSESIDCVITSPPYWGLRNYGDDASTIWDGNPRCDHQWGAYKRPGITGGTNNNINKSKGKANSSIVESSEQSFCIHCGAWRGMLGLEPFVSLYIKHLADIFDEVYRVLKPSGTCWINLGDTYYSISGGMYLNDNISTADKNIQRGVSNANALRKNREFQQKCLTMVPSRFAIEMIDRGWILRNEIIWWKPNVLPTSTTDRFTVDFEKFYFFTKSQKYFFDQQFESYAPGSNMAWRKSMGFGRYYRTDAPEDPDAELEDDRQSFYNPKGRNMRTVWHVSTKPFPEAHFATYPLNLVRIPLIAGCPEFVCPKCGQPRYKEYKTIKTDMDEPYHDEIVSTDKVTVERIELTSAMLKIKEFDHYDECKCGEQFVPGIVLDPFMGSGTTALAAKKSGRDYVGIEINPEYIKISDKRLDDKQLALFGG